MAITKMKGTIKQKLELVEEAISDWKEEKLSDLSAIVAIGIIINENTPSDEAIQWGMETLAKIGLAKELAEKNKEQ